MDFEKIYAKLPDSIKYNNYILDFFLKIPKKLQNLNKKSNQLNSQNQLLDLLFTSCDIKIKGNLRNVQLLYIELLRFVDNVCKKHDIDYWLEGGTLIGAVRHGGFIPWDDDIDLSIMRKDYEKLIKVLPEEISKYEYFKENCGLSLLIENQKNYFEGFRSVYDVDDENGFLDDNKFSLEELKQENKKAFITYTTAGLPDYDTTKKIMFAQEKAGIDIMEIGVPFSDPIADGPVIQDASFKAIQNGASLEGTFTMMGKVRKAGLNSPVVFMLYYNTVYHYGVENFVNKCIENGVDGLIIPDLPFEEQGEIKDVLAKNEKSPILIQLVSPVSKGRIPMLLENARGFVYCVSQMGVTGKGANFHSQIREYLTEVKKESKIPVIMGFGIRTAADVAPLEDIIDGAIVGSHFIKLLEANNYSEEAATDYVATFKKELNA